MDTGQLLNNRAQCHLKTGNMQAALQDTAAAIHTCTLLTNSPVGVEVLPHTKNRQRPSSMDTYMKALMR